MESGRLFGRLKRSVELEQPGDGMGRHGACNSGCLGLKGNHKKTKPAHQLTWNLAFGGPFKEKWSSRTRERQVPWKLVGGYVLDRLLATNNKGHTHTWPCQHWSSFLSRTLRKMRHAFWKVTCSIPRFHKAKAKFWFGHRCGCTALT